MRVIVVHGSYGHPGENWFPWLKAELERLGCTVEVPQFPTPDGQNLDSWLEVLRAHPLDEDTIVVGHSIGPAFLLSVIQELAIPIKAAYFVAGFVGSLGNPEFDRINASFVEPQFDWERIRAHCELFCVINSDNDPYVPLELGRELAENLRVPLTLVHGAGHFNVATGYTRFPLLLELITAELE